MTTKFVVIFALIATINVGDLSRARAASASEAPSTSVAPEIAFLSTDLRLRWGDSRTQAATSLGAVFKLLDHNDLVTTSDGHLLGLATFTGTVNGYANCTILALFKDNRLAGIEVIIPPQPAVGSAMLFQRVMSQCVTTYRAETIGVSFELRNASETEVGLRGKEFCTPEIIARCLENPDGAKVDRGMLKAEGLILLASGGLLHLQTPSHGMTTKSEFYRLGCLVIGLKDLNSTVVAAAKQEILDETSVPSQERVSRADSDAADYELPELKAIRAQAEAGELSAQIQLARMYVQGDEVSADRDQAIRWCRMALENGDEASAFKLATLYCNKWYSFWPPFSHEPTAAEYVQAAALFERAGSKGNAMAWVRLAELHRDGHGVKKDPAAFRQFMERAAVLDNEIAHYELARLDAPNAALNSEQGRRHLERAAILGHVHAADELARLYLAPISGRPQPEKAVRWLEFAAFGPQYYDTNSLVHARLKLSEIYESGTGAPRNAVEALKWQLIAAAGYQPDNRAYFAPAIARLHKGMSASAIAEAERKSRAWLDAHPRDENRSFPF